LIRSLLVQVPSVRVKPFMMHKTSPWLRGPCCFFGDYLRGSGVGLENQPFLRSCCGPADGDRCLEFGTLPRNEQGGLTRTMNNPMDKGDKRMVRSPMPRCGTWRSQNPRACCMYVKTRLGVPIRGPVQVRGAAGYRMMATEASQRVSAPR
jgi:hypothetical protein